MARVGRVRSTAEELNGAELGDLRRTERLRTIANSLESEPAKSFPRAMGSDSALEAFYRFIKNDGFDAADIVAPHIAATLDRAAQAGTAIALHDTTHVEYGATRADLGPTNGKNHFGFLAHVALLVGQDGLPLGVGHVETFRRDGTKWRKRKKEGQRARVHAHDETRESLRWLRGMRRLEATKNQDLELIHVTDAEGDFFELLACLRDSAARFVIRAGQLDRIIEHDGEKTSLRAAIDRFAPRASRRVALSKRKHPRQTNILTRRRHPDRAARVARVAIAAEQIVFCGTRYADVQAEPIWLNVVRVWEPRPPKGEPAVEWVLLTTEDVSSEATLERVVDLYRARWIIEEFFKALKSGCSLENRQIESYNALCKVLALFLPIAYRLLLLRGVERQDSRAPAKKVFSPPELTLMNNAPANRGHRAPKTIAEAMQHLARMGGHIRNNGRPGWQTLAWGYEKLLLMRLGWEVAMAAQGLEEM